MQRPAGRNGQVSAREIVFHIFFSTKAVFQLHALGQSMSFSYIHIGNMLDA